MKLLAARLLGLVVACVGVVAIVGWSIENEALTRLFVSPSTLKFNTAVCLVALGLAGFVTRPPKRSLLAAGALLVAGATVVERITGSSLGIDELVFDDPFTSKGPPGRMVVGTALALALLATGVLGLQSRHRRVRIAAVIPVVAGGAIGFVGLVGYAARLNALYWNNDVTSMSLQAAVGIALLAAAFLIAAPNEGLVAVVMRPTPGGRLLRRLLPGSVLLTSAFVLPIGWGTTAGYIDLGVPMLILWIGSLLALFPLLFWTAHSLDRAEARARADAQRFEGVLRAATETSIIGTDTNGTITVFNEGAERMLGYSADEVIGSATPALIHDPDEVEARAAELGIDPGFEVLVAAARENRAETREWTYVRKDGSRIPVSLTVTAMSDAEGSQSGFIGMAFDLTGRRELERELRRQAEVTGTLVGSAPVGIYATDADGSCIFVNAKWQELAGMTESDALGDGWRKALHPEDAETVTRAWVSFTTLGTPFATEYRFQRPDGTRVWLAGQAVALRSEDGAVTGYLGTILDVTQRREAQAQRERLLAESRAVLDAATDGILMTDLKGDVLFSNAAMGSFWEDTGLAGEGTIWDRIAMLADRLTSADEYYRLLEAVALDPVREHVGEFTIAATGRSFVGRTAPVRRTDGSLMGRIFSVRETTTERAAARAKDEFVATVSHELRTPLAAITGYAELLEDDVAALGEESAQFLSVLQRNADRLTRLVDDLLLLQQTETAGVTIHSDDVDVDELVRLSLERVEPAATRKRIELGTRGDTGLVVPGDVMRLGQVLDNLLSNAVKFTPDGGTVDVIVTRVGGACRIEVHDSGPGIPEEDRSRLFERFFRSRDAVARAIPGTGLGLVVSRRIAEAHGGALELADGDGSGSVFRLTLPCPVTARPGGLRLLKSPTGAADTPFE